MVEAKKAGRRRKGNDRKKKKYWILAGGVLVCVLLICVIGVQFQKEEEQPMVAFGTETESETDLLIEPDAITESADPGQTETETMMEDSEEETETIDETEGEEETMQEQTDTARQSIQPEVTKPKEPESEVLTNPSQKPDGTPAEVPDETTDTGVSASPESEISEPQAGDTSNGQIYIPGFGWVEDEGGGVNSIPVDDMYENGNKIGIMD